MIEPGHIFDVTRTLGFDALPYPGDPAFEREAKEHGGVTVSRLTMSSHSGTHLDAPAHVFPGGKTLDEYPPERFFLSAHVVEAKSERVITAADVNALRLEEYEAVLFKTRDSEPSRAHKPLPWISFSPDAATALVRCGVRLVGIDSPSVDAADATELPVHRTLLGADVLVLEDCDLREVPAGGYELVCMPLRVRTSDGAPCRCVLIMNGDRATR
ncbi:MAG TPA: cyclase family protein [Candidatus Latescibacteria bacterium]|nr:cyclase family protein [Candidatus Latescibacterota bacterium]HOF62063.1 cyclase family protein [Candidatus Latescibacterota bacterium]HOS64509.1 cyclase family protein [Candidatus Latescibacterota bacterium]HPK74016.1 cyclase family protein [Candidatus Latescibacterota bacterium]